MALQSASVEDLREYRDTELLRTVYEGLYSESFNIPEEREGLDQYQRRLWGPLKPPPAPCTHFLVAGQELRDPARRQVYGFLICEAYRESACGLVTFLAVSSGHRGHGVARGLLIHALGLLRAEVPALVAVFAEAHRPAWVVGDTIDPYVRLEVLHRLGAGLLPFHYVQPELSPGQGRSYNLVLLSLFETLAKQPRQLPCAAVVRFLHEFYRALGLHNPHADQDFAGMVREIFAGGVSLDPALTTLLDSVALLEESWRCNQHL